MMPNDADGGAPRDTVPDRPRRSWPRRVARAVAALTLLALLPVAAVTLLLHTSVGGALLRRGLEGWGSRATGGTLRIAELELRPSSGQARLGAVSLVVPGVELDVQRIEIDWSPRGGVHVRLLQPRVMTRADAGLERAAAPAHGLAAQPWRVLEKPGQLEVRQGRIEVRDEAGAPQLVLEGVELEVAGAGGRPGSFRIADASVGPGARGSPARIEGTFHLDGSALVIESARVSAGSSALDLHGRLERLQPTTATLAARATLDGGSVSAFVPEADLQGQVEVDAEIQVTNDLPSGRLRADVPALTARGVGPWAVRTVARLHGGELVIDSLTARGFGGLVEVAGELALASPAAASLRGRIDGIDPAALAKAVSGSSIPLAARVAGSFRVTTTGGLEAARGDGRLVLTPAAGPGLKPTGVASLKVDGPAFSLDARVEGRGARATAAVALEGQGTLRGRWSADLDLASLPSLAAELGRAAPGRAAEGRLRAEGELGGALGEPEVTARVSSHALSVDGVALALEADARYERGRLSLAPLVLRAGDGQATLRGQVPLLPTESWDLEGKIDAPDLAPLLALAGLDGEGPLAGTVRLRGPRDAPAGQASLRVRATVRRPFADPAPGAAEGAAGPAESTVMVAVEARSRGRAIEVASVQAEAAGGRAWGSGRYDAASGAMALTLSAQGLAWQRLPLLPEWAGALTGTLSGEVQLTGTPRAPTGHLRLGLTEPRVGDTALPPVSVEARFDGRELRVTGTSDAVFLRGHAALEGDWPLRLEVDLGALPLQPFLETLPAAQEAGATLDARGALVVELPLREPARLRYSSPDLALAGRIRGLEWRMAPFALRGDRESLELDGARLEAGRAWLGVRGRVALAPASPFDARVEGNLDLGALDAALPGAGLGGGLELELQVSGTRESPELDGAVRLSNARGRVAGVPWDELDLVAHFASGQVQVETMQASLLGGEIRASGRFPLDRTADAGALAFELRDLDLARLLPPNPSQARKPHALVVSLDGEVRAAAPSLDSIAGGGRLTRLEARSADGSLGLAAPAEWTLEAGRLDVGAIRLAGPLGALEARVEARIAAPIGLSATVEGGADLSALDPFLDGATLAGPARLDLRVGYSPSGLRIEGGVVVENARVSLEELQLVATDLGGELRFDGERVKLEARAAVGEGKLRLHGGMQLGPALVGPAELTLEADRVPIHYPPGFRGRASGALTLAGDAGRYRLGGTVNLNQSYFTGQLDARAQALDRLAWQLAALDGGLLNQVSLDVRLRLAEPLRVRNPRIQLDAEGAVQAGGTLAQPTASGHVTLREGGEVTLGRSRVRVTGGRVELNNHPAGIPEVDFQGHTRVSGVAMDIRARGALDDLQLTLSSDQAELTQADLVTLMLTGRTATAAASQGGVVVAEQLAVALGGVLQRGVGDSLLIDVSPERSLLSDDNTDPTQRFNIGTRVTQNLTVIYSATLDGTGRRWIVELNPGRGRFRLRAISEEDGSFSLEATDRLSFDLWNRGRRGAAPARERERLTDLRFEGALPVPERDLRRTARLRTGRRSSWLQREQAADRVRERLVREGYRQASVDASSIPAPGGVELVLRVDAGPRVTLGWTGDNPGRRARREGERAWLPFSTPEAAAAAVARAALWRLQSEGFHGALVEPQLSSTEGRLDVRLHVTRGARGRGVDLVFEGNTVLAADALAAGLPSPGSSAFFEMLDVRSARISSEVRMAYAGIGHLQAQVGKVHSAVDPATGRLRVTIAVSEGAPSTVLGIELPAEATDPGGPRLGLTVGQPFDIAAYSADRETLGAWYRAQGFIDAEVRAALEPEKGGVRVLFLVDPGPRPRVGETRVAQTGRTRSSLIERSLTLSEGDLVKAEALSESRERLWELGLFRSVELTAEPRPRDDTVRDLQVSLVDRPDVSVEYGLRYTTAGEGGAAGGPPSTPESGQFHVAGAIELNDPLALGARARAYGSATRERRSWGFNLDAATLAGRRVRTQLFFFDDHDDHQSIAGLASHVRGASLQQSRVLLRDRRSRRWHDRLRLQWGYVFKDVEYSASARGTPLLQGDRGFLSLGAIGDERDSLTDPKRGIFWTANTELARTGLGSDVDYLRLYGQLFAYVPIGPLVWAQGYRFGSVPGENPRLLLENRFYAGGPTTVRGFEQNGLGALTIEGNAIGGQAVAILNQELRFPIWKSLQGGVFWDAGNAWLTSDGLDLGDLRQSVGGGLRWVFPFGPIRVEYAWVVGRRPGEPRGRFVFGLGHAF